MLRYTLIEQSVVASTTQIEHSYQLLSKSLETILRYCVNDLAKFCHANLCIHSYKSGFEKTY